MTDPVRGENPVWVANYKKKDRCLTASTEITVEIVFKDPLTNIIITNIIKGQKISVDYIVEFKTKFECETIPCTGPTGILQPNCAKAVDRRTDPDVSSPPGETVGGSPTRFYQKIHYKVGCCSKKCSKTDNATTSTIDYVSTGNEYTALRNWDLRDALQGSRNFGGGGAAAGVFWPDRPSAGGMTELDQKDYDEKKYEWLSAVGLNLGTEVTEISITPGSEFDQKFKRPCS